MNDLNIEPDFGIFEPVFESAHGYLPLLHLSTDDAAKSVALVQDCCCKVNDPFPDICRLLKDTNWRPHLVAAVAAIVSGHDGDTVGQLWRRLDSGSWVTPQLGVALFLVDPEFETQSRARLEAGCPVDLSDLLSMTGLERHSAAGPAGASHRSAKAAAALLQLLGKTWPVPSWLGPLAASEAMQALLREDIDASHDIAEQWLHRIQQMIKSGAH